MDHVSIFGFHLKRLPWLNLNSYKLNITHHTLSTKFKHKHKKIDALRPKLTKIDVFNTNISKQLYNFKHKTVLN